MTDGLSYEDWKTDLTIWENSTEIEKKRQGSIVFLSLKGKATETVRASVLPEDLSKEDGVKAITKALDKLFLKEASQDQFETFDSFINFRRPNSMSIKDFIIEWDLKYKKITNHKMNLPEGVQAYALLKCANLSSNQEQLCRATCFNLNYKEMKRQIERISSQSEEEITFIAQESPLTPQNNNTSREEFFYQDHQLLEESYEDMTQGESGHCETYFTRPYHNRASQWKGATKRTMNPVDQFGNPMPCSYCRSIYHWADKCPDAPAPKPQNFSHNRQNFQPRQRFTYQYQSQSRPNYQPRQPRPYNQNSYNSNQIRNHQPQRQL